MAIVYIALGSNIKPQENLVAAMALLGQELQVGAASRVYRTPPWGDEPQPPFLNAAVAALTELPPLPLLELLQQIETSRGRERNIPNGPRTMDLDLLFYDDLVLNEPRLTLPHPRLHERGFVLAPLCDLAPSLRHPLLNKSIKELKNGVSLEGITVAKFPVAD